MQQLNLKHSPQRPGWDCEECGHPWPCAEGRAELLQKCGTTIELALVTWDAFEKAVFDIGSVTPATVLYLRFVGWTRNSPRTQ